MGMEIGLKLGNGNGRRKHHVFDVLPSVRLSVPAWAHNSKSAPAGLLLLAWQSGDVD